MASFGDGVLAGIAVVLLLAVFCAVSYGMGYQDARRNAAYLLNNSPCPQTQDLIKRMP